MYYITKYFNFNNYFSHLLNNFDFMDFNNSYNFKINLEYLKFNCILIKINSNTPLINFDCLINYLKIYKFTSFIILV